MKGSAVTSLLLLLVGEAFQQEQVSLLQGDLQGARMTSRNGREFHAFLGIPFAQPPVGELRFKAPEPPLAWKGLLNATADGPLCIQKNYLDLNPQVQGQEDCLYLNVYTPHLRPPLLMNVMVHIHGGGFFSGTGASFLQGPQYFMDHDVVVVSFNYRLGVMGFLSTEDQASPGNYGFKDQVAALRWVQNNIAAFGGDPNCVTIFGQSAGATSVHLHMLSPLSAGLFQRAISESGSALAPFAWPVDTAAIAKRQALAAGCDPDSRSDDMVHCLRQMDAKKLVDSGDAFKFWSVDPLDVFGPAIEQGPGAFLTANPFFLLKTGQFHRVPWLTGVVNDEGLVRAAAYLTNPVLREELNRRFSVLGPRLFELNKSLTGADHQQDYVWQRMRNFFMGGAQQISADNERGFINMYSDRAFIHSFHKSVLMHQKALHTELFLYHFNYRGQYSFSAVFANTTRDLGVSHCDDLIYLWSIPLLFPAWPAGHPDLDVSRKLVEVFVHFAKHGHPGEPWQPVRAGPHADYVEIGAGPNLTLKQDLFRERMEFWDSLPLVENNFRDTTPQHLIDIMYSYIVYLLD